MEGGEILGKVDSGWGTGYGEEGTLRGWPIPRSLPRATDLERPRPFGLLPAKVELSSNRQAHKEPVTEAEVVDEQENILHSEVDERHGALEGEGEAGVSSVTTTRDPRRLHHPAISTSLPTVDSASPDHLRFSSATPWYQKAPFSTFKMENLSLKVASLPLLLGALPPLNASLLFAIASFTSQTPFPF